MSTDQSQKILQESSLQDIIKDVKMYVASCLDARTLAHNLFDKCV